MVDMFLLMQPVKTYGSIVFSVAVVNRKYPPLYCYVVKEVKAKIL